MVLSISLLSVALSSVISAVPAFATKFFSGQYSHFLLQHTDITDQTYQILYNGNADQNEIPLSIGENAVTITVVNKEGITNTYKVTITREEDAVTVTSCPVVVADFVMQLSCFAVPGVSVGVCSFPVIICVHFAVTTVSSGASSESAVTKNGDAV